jgi:hypothetical protein
MPAAREFAGRPAFNQKFTPNQINRIFLGFSAI